MTGKLPRVTAAETIRALGSILKDADLTVETFEELVG